MDAANLEVSHKAVSCVVSSLRGVWPLLGNLGLMRVTWQQEAGITWCSFTQLPHVVSPHALGFPTRRQLQAGQNFNTAAVVSSISVPVEKEEGALPFCFPFYFFPKSSRFKRRRHGLCLPPWGWRGHCIEGFVGQMGSLHLSSEIQSATKWIREMWKCMYSTEVFFSFPLDPQSQSPKSGI